LGADVQSLNMGREHPKENPAVFHASFSRIKD